MLRIEADTVIYVLCPSHIVTGGIEAVHQLVDKLRGFGHEAVIVPVPRVSNPILLQYRNYDVRFEDQIEDHERNLLITTEVDPRALDGYPSIQKALWWLSVDNHEQLEKRFDFDSPHNQDVIHFAQSAYAQAFLRQKGVKRIHPLTDYLHASYFKAGSPGPKQNLVLYTPAKGAEAYVNQLKSVDPSIHWLALRGLIRKQHANVLRQGKVYVDFGTHPGKDRQPREAVVNGCCVVVGRKGAACFAEDIPIDDAYKFSCELFEAVPIVETIQDCLANYNKRFLDFQTYAAIVREEETHFENEVKAIFGVRSLQTRPRNLTALANTFTYIRQNTAFVASRGIANEILPLAITNSARRLYRALKT